ncbi:MAG TPA: hypothetical protein VLX92_30600 [Kofleriaceae bacterium]|nr:hypothetical protein [Kofleriaceae bacterium]
MKLVAIVILAGCVDAASSTDQQPVGATQYTEIADFSGTDQGAWFDLVGALGQAFSAQCPATFCTGSYANLTPLSIHCSVTSKRGDVHDCVWTFAGSAVAVDPTSAAIAIDAPTFQCHFAPRTTAPKLVAALAGQADPLHVALPGLDAGIAGTLGACFANPIGATPLGGAPVGATYVAASDYYVTAANLAKWRATQSALVSGFDNLCGDTFCGSDFGDLQSLDLECAVTRSTGNVKACQWLFGGSYAVVGGSGALDVTSRTFHCAIAMKSTLAQLIATITATGTDDPIQRALPGETTSAYDALGGCLP